MIQIKYHYDLFDEVNVGSSLVGCVMKTDEDLHHALVRAERDHCHIATTVCCVLAKVDAMSSRDHCCFVCFILCFVVSLLVSISIRYRSALNSRPGPVTIFFN